MSARAGWTFALALLGCLSGDRAAADLADPCEGVVTHAGGSAEPAGREENEPFDILMVLYRGLTRVERGFFDYIREQRIPVRYEICTLDLNRETQRPGRITIDGAPGAERPLSVQEVEILTWLDDNEVDYRYEVCPHDPRVEGERVALSSLMRERMARQPPPDLVYTWGTTVTLGVVGTYDGNDPDRHVTDVPVVFTMVSQPVQSKVVRSLESSCRNVTGTSHLISTEVQLKAIHSYHPFDKLAVIHTGESAALLNIDELAKLSERLEFDSKPVPENPEGAEMQSLLARGYALEERPPELGAGGEPSGQATRRMSRRGFELLIRRVPRGPDGRPQASALARLVQELAAEGADYLYIGPDVFVGEHAKLVASAAIKECLPTFTATELELRESDTLMGLVARYKNLGKFTAYKAEQVLVQRIPPRDLPIETLKRYSFIVKLDVARAIGAYPPMSLFKYAEFVAPEGAIPPAASPCPSTRDAADR